MNHMATTFLKQDDDVAYTFLSKIIQRKYATIITALKRDIERKRMICYTLVEERTGLAVENIFAIPAYFDIAVRRKAFKLHKSRGAEFFLPYTLKDYHVDTFFEP